jgi:hypothetical protein
MPGSAVHVRLRYWSALSLPILLIVVWAPTAAFADGTVPLSEQVSQATDQVSGTGRALAAALVGIFLASLARRRESRDLLATFGYS